MNYCLRNTRSLLSQIMHRCKAPGAAQRLMLQDLGLSRGTAHIKPLFRGQSSTSPPRRFAPQRLMQDLGLNRGSAHIKPLFRRQYTSPPSFVLRWYHEPQKVAAAMAITLSAAAMAACSRYDREIVPCTYRSHLVIYSHQEERDIGDSVFAKHFANYVILDPSDPRSVRVRRIAEKIVHAAYRGLGIYDSNDAPMLRVTEKRRRKWWGTAQQPHTSHIRQLNWDVILIHNDYPFAGIIPSGKITVSTGLFDWIKTDEEITAILAHEVGHVIARYSADINTISFLHDMIFARRMEIEADYIGILLLGAAGFHPQWFHVMMEKVEKFQIPSSRCPSAKKRLQLLSEAKTMEEALELYREATALDIVTDRYFR